MLLDISKDAMKVHYQTACPSDLPSEKALRCQMNAISCPALHGNVGAQYVSQHQMELGQKLGGSTC